MINGLSRLDFIHLFQYQFHFVPVGTAGGIHTRYTCEDGMKQRRKTAENIDQMIKFKK